jgi:RHS repeat-associated protein
MLTDTRALGKPEVQKTTYTLQSGTNFVLSITDQLNRRTDFTYDSFGNHLTRTQLANTSQPATTTWTYESTFNQVARTNLSAAIATASYNAANQQLTLGNTSLSYDLDGNLTLLTDPSVTTTYTWNGRNQLTSLSGPGGLSASFTHDAAHRLNKTLNGAATKFVLLGSSVVQERLGSGTVKATLFPGLGMDEVFGRTEGTVNNWFLPDGLGSTLGITDTNGVVQTQYPSDPFGQTTVTGATSTNTFAFTGRENDGTGLYYYRNCYYHPGLQRFVSEDPSGFAGGVNPYVYVKNNPMNAIDPLGPGNLLFGVGGSAVMSGGVEGSGGIAINSTSGEAVRFATVGTGIGLNVSSDIFVGYTKGDDLKELEGPTRDVNYVAGPFSVTLIYNVQGDTFLGGTLGYGPSLTYYGESETVDYTQLLLPLSLEDFENNGALPAPVCQ